MKNPQGKSIGAPSARRATSAVAAQLRDDLSFDTDPVLTDPGDAYLNADNGWPATGAEAAALQEEYDALANLFLSDEPQTPVAKATQAAAAAPPHAALRSARCQGQAQLAGQERRCPVS